MDDKNLGSHIDASKHQRWTHIIQATLVLFIIAGVIARYWQNRSTASLMTERSVAISSSKASEVATHTFTYTLAGGTNVASIVFQYCANSPFFDQPCTAPTGMNADSAILASQSGETGFSIDPAGTNANTIVLTRASASATTSGQSSYSFNSISNPSLAGQSYFVRISAHSSIDGSGTPTDQGAVVFALTNTELTVGAYVPPYLAFCVGQTLGANCSSASGFDLNMGSLSESTTAVQTTQISGATNVADGYTVYVLGYTLTAGTNIIPALAVPATSSVGTSQFGLNARANSTPAVGQEPAGVGTLAPIGSYNTPNTFKYVSGEAIASSATSTDFNTLTVSYIANTSKDQPAGVYTTTLTYVATSTF